MRRRKILIIIGALLLILGAYAFFPSREPSYEGRTVTQWVEYYVTSFDISISSGVRVHAIREDSESRQDRALNAIRHIGPKAIPYLIKCIDFEEPAWKVRFSDYLKKSGCVEWKPVQRMLWHLEKPRIISNQTPVIFRALGPAAEDAIPTLMILLNKREGGVWQNAAQALADIGPKALPPLIEALSDPNRIDPSAVIWTLHIMRTNATPAIPRLALCLQEYEDPDFNSFVCVVLKELGADPGLVVPALIDAIGDPGRRNARAIDYLRSFSPPPSNAIPALLAALSDTNWWTRCSATNALNKIDPYILQNARP